MPPTGAPPDVLWDRFAEVAGIPEGLCDLEVRSNPGIDAASALVLRALNERLAEDEISPQDYQRLVKGALAKQGLAKRGRETASPWGSTSAGYAAAPGTSWTSCGSSTSASSVTSTSSRRGRCPACTPRR